jgi:hypothetical protein
MNINIEFFDTEPMENIITCLHFEMDKVIFFGYSDHMTREKIQTTRKSLRRTCGMENVEFIEVSRMDLNRDVEILESVIRKETAAGNQCFVDLTGGKDLIMAAMGIVSTRCICPIHRFDMRTGKLRILNNADIPSIEASVKRKQVNFTLDDVIGVYGGMINYHDQKSFKTRLDDEVFAKDMKNLWLLARQDQRKWNGFSAVLKACTHHEDGYGNVWLLENELCTIAGNSVFMKPVDRFYDYLRRLCNMGIMKNFKVDQGYVSFSYKNDSVRDVLLDAGSLLEIMTYYSRKSTGKYSDCRIGVHIDWDGVITGHDVKNEIDVMLLEGFSPVFISCKNGKVDQMALYELDTVAKRFGGKYAKKILMAGQEISEGYLLRAEEMDIECVLSKNISV